MNSIIIQNRLTKSLENRVHLLIYIYILMAPFQNLGLKFIGINFGPSELIFLVLTPFAIIYVINSKKKLLINKLDLCVFLWFITNIIAGWHAKFDTIVMTEIIKVSYLSMLYIMIKWSITELIFARIVKTIILSSIIAALTGIIGFVLAHFSIDSLLIIKRVFPYGFEYITQAKGFTASPNMLASMIMIGILFQIQTLKMNDFNFSAKDLSFLIILVIGFALTFSKTIMCLLIGIILVINNKSNKYSLWRLVNKICVIVLLIFYFLGTHFIIINKDQNIENLKGDYIAGSKLLETANYSIYPSQYWSLKIISFSAISQSFPVGLGPGKFNDYAHYLKKNYSYPLHVPYPDPHSTYLGVFAETGLIGIGVLLITIITLIKYCIRILSAYNQSLFIFSCLPIIFLVIGIEAISTDIMNFKHYWILLILLSEIFNNLNTSSG